MASRIETLDFVKVMLGVQTTCGLLERMPDVRHFEWMKSEKKTLTNQTLLARHQPTSYESYVLNFPHHYVESTVISYIQQLIARYYIVYYITKITRLLERYRETVSPQPETLSD